MTLVKEQYEKYGTQKITVTIESSDPTDRIVIYKLTVSIVIPTHPHNNRSEQHLFDMNDGVPKWLTNRHVIPQDFIEENFINKLPMFSQFNTDLTRDMQNRDLLEAYRKRMKNHKPDDEEMYEMRAAFGRGTTVVNAITGKRTRL
jgi:hypothetical protein